MAVYFTVNGSSEIIIFVVLIPKDNKHWPSGSLDGFPLAFWGQRSVIGFKAEALHCEALWNNSSVSSFCELFHVYTAL